MINLMKYQLKIWLTTLIPSPILVMLVLYVLGSSFSSSVSATLGIYFFILGMSFLFSAPGMALYLLLDYGLQKSALSNPIRQMVLASGGVSLVFLSFAILDADSFIRSSPEGILWPIVYSVIQVLSVAVFYPTKRQEA